MCPQGDGFWNEPSEIEMLFCRYGYDEPWMARRTRVEHGRESRVVPISSKHILLFHLVNVI